MSQEALAGRSGLHPVYISQIERGLKSPTIGTLWMLAEALGVAPSVLVEEAESNPFQG